MKIGDICIKNGIFLGPMAGITDMSFRLLCSREGADATVSEMVSAKALSYGNKKTQILLQVHEEERIVGLQLFGRDPHLISEAIKSIDNERISFFDINMGCPVPKVVNNGEGVALMKEPKLVDQIIGAMARASEKPITVKIRKGFEENVNGIDIARIAQNAGAKAIAIHARTREEYYSGRADWDYIRQVNEAVKIPVIASGDIVDGQSALKIKEETACQGIMVARAARGNPWIFREIKESFKRQSPISYRPSRQELVDVIFTHAKLLLELKGEYIGMREMRKHLGYYTKGYRNSAQLRRDSSKINTFADFEKIVYNIMEI